MGRILLQSNYDGVTSTVYFNSKKELYKRIAKEAEKFDLTGVSKSSIQKKFKKNKSLGFKSITLKPRENFKLSIREVDKDDSEKKDAVPQNITISTKNVKYSALKPNSKNIPESIKIPQFFISNNKDISVSKIRFNLNDQVSDKISNEEEIVEAHLTRAVQSSVRTVLENENVQLSNSYIKVTVKMSSGFDIVSTFSVYERVMRNIKNGIKRYLNQYEDIFIESVEVEYYTLSDLNDRPIFSNKKTDEVNFEKFKSISHYNHKFKKFLKRFNINCVKSQKYCIENSSYFAYMKKYFDKEVVPNRCKPFQNYISKSFKDVKFETLTNQCRVDKIATFLKCNIEIFNTEGEKFLTSNTAFETNICLLYFMSHVFPLQDNSSNSIQPEIQITPKPENQEQFTSKKCKINYSDFNVAWDIETYNNNNKSLSTYAIGYRADPETWGEIDHLEDNYGCIYKQRNSPIEIEKIFLQSIFQLVEYLKTKDVEKDSKKRIVFYAHNGGKFDVQQIFKYLLRETKFSSYITTVIKNGRFISLELSIKEIVIVFRDSYCHLQGSLDSLLKEFKCETAKGSINHSEVNESNYDKIKEYVIPYLKADVYGLLELIKKLENTLKNNYNISLNSCMTSASIARKYFMLNHDHEKFPIYNLDMDTYRIYSKGYFGGRCENFFQGEVKDKITYMDFTSEYPYVMRKYKYPFGKYTVKDVDNYDPDWNGMVVCKVKSTDEVNSGIRKLIAYKDPESYRLTFPHFSDYTEIVLDTPTLHKVVKENHPYKFKFMQVINYEEKDYIFTDIIDTAYSVKKDQDVRKGKLSKLNAEYTDKNSDIFKKKVKEINYNPALRTMAKVIINSLYGFFGIRQTDVENVKLWAKPMTKENEVDNVKFATAFHKFIESDELMEFTEIDERRVLVKTMGDRPIKISNVVIASHVTANARNLLYDLITDVDKTKDISGNPLKMLYCDTDSVVVQGDVDPSSSFAKKWKYVAKGKELGDLTNEKETLEPGKRYFDSGAFATLKMYTLFSNSTVESLRTTLISKSSFNKILKDSTLVIKMKGVNTNNKYLEKIIDHEKRNITLKGIENFKSDELSGSKEATKINKVWRRVENNPNLEGEWENEEMAKIESKPDLYFVDYYNEFSNDKKPIFKDKESTRKYEKLVKQGFKIKFLKCVNHEDIILISKGYTLTTDNFTFVSGVSRLKDETQIEWMKNKKNCNNKYTKGIVTDSGFTNPISI